LSGFTERAHLVTAPDRRGGDEDDRPSVGEVPDVVRGDGDDPPIGSATDTRPKVNQTIPSP
jgi:hypothetical protein